VVDCEYNNKTATCSEPDDGKPCANHSDANTCPVARCAFEYNPDNNNNYPRDEVQRVVSMCKASCSIAPTRATASRVSSRSWFAAGSLSGWSPFAAHGSTRPCRYACVSVCVYCFPRADQRAVHRHTRHQPTACPRDAPGTMYDLGPLSLDFRGEGVGGGRLSPYDGQRIPWICSQTPFFPPERLQATEKCRRKGCQDFGTRLSGFWHERRLHCAIRRWACLRMEYKLFWRWWLPRG